MKNGIFKLLTGILILLVFTAIILSAVYKKPPVKKQAPVILGRIVIVIDDWGYSLNNLPIIQQIKIPLTCAILPGLKDSDAVMKRLDSLGLEIILHLPMEPKGRHNLEKDTITLGMSAERISEILDKDLSSVNLAKGVSNHMGSRVTENKKTSLIVLSEIKKRNRYFFDSFVTNDSVCFDLAKKMGIKTAKRDIFLDDRSDFDYIKGNLIKLKNLARKRGIAIGIGHDRKNTLLVLKETLPQMEKEGYRFLFLSEVVQ